VRVSLAARLHQQQAINLLLLYPRHPHRQFRTSAGSAVVPTPKPVETPSGISTPAPEYFALGSDTVAIGTITQGETPSGQGNSIYSYWTFKVEDYVISALPEKTLTIRIWERDEPSDTAIAGIKAVTGTWAGEELTTERREQVVNIVLDDQGVKEFLLYFSIPGPRIICRFL